MSHDKLKQLSINRRTPYKYEDTSNQEAKLYQKPIAKHDSICNSINFGEDKPSHDITAKKMHEDIYNLKSSFSEKLRQIEYLQTQLNQKTEENLEFEEKLIARELYIHELLQKIAEHKNIDNGINTLKEKYKAQNEIHHELYESENKLNSAIKSIKTELQVANKCCSLVASIEDVVSQCKVYQRTVKNIEQSSIECLNIAIDTVMK